MRLHRLAVPVLAGLAVLTASQVLLRAGKDPRPPIGAWELRLPAEEARERAAG